MRILYSLKGWSKRDISFKVNFTIFNSTPSVHNAHHRISTARKIKGGGRHFFHRIEPNWPMPYSTVPVPRQAVSPIAVHTYMHEYNAETQNVAGKGSILLWRRFTLPIFLLFIYMVQYKCIFIVSIFRYQCRFCLGPYFLKTYWF